MAASLGKAAAGAALVASSTVLAGPAAADPVNAPSIQMFELTCGDRTVDVVVNGRGNFTPAHDTRSNRVLVPTMFGEFTGTLTDEDGQVIETFSDPLLSKGSSSKPRRTSVTCTYTVSEDFEDPELGLLHFEGTGDVTGFFTPARR